MGGAPVTTNWVLDSFARAWAGTSMLRQRGQIRPLSEDRELVPDHDATRGGDRISQDGDAVIISLGTAPCRDESRDRASANRPPESFINGLVFTLKGLTLAR